MDAPGPAQGRQLQVRTFPVGMLQCNCTILARPDLGSAIVIDPGGDLPTITATLDALGVQPSLVVHTHAHLDHLGESVGVSALGAGPQAEEGASKGPAPLALHPGDRWLWDHVDEQARAFGFPVPQTAPIGRWLQAGERLSLGDDEVTVLHTPGHTPGSCCFLLQREGCRTLLLSGDTLFAGSIGRSDLWGGDHDQLLRSIRTSLLGLPDQTLVVPGHGPLTDIQTERATNPYVGEDASLDDGS